MLGGQPADLGVESLGRGDDPHVRGCGLRDDRRDLPADPFEQRTQFVEVVVGKHDGVGRGSHRHPCASRQPLGGHTRTGGGQQRIRVSVIAAREFDDLVAARGTAGDPHRGHGGLRAGGDQPHVFRDGNPGTDPLGELHLRARRCPETEAPGGRLLHGRDDLRMGVPEQRRPPGTHEIDVAGAVDVGHSATGCLLDETRRAAHGRECPHGRVDPARDRLAGPCHPFLVQSSHSATSNAQ